MKTYYLHVSYQFPIENGHILLGDCLIKATDLSLKQMREHIKNNNLNVSPVILSISEISKGLFEMLSKK